MLFSCPAQSLPGTGDAGRTDLDAVDRFPHLAVLFSHGIGVRFELRSKILEQGGTFLRRSTWDRLWLDVAALSSLFEGALDGRCRDGKLFCHLVLAGSCIDSPQHPGPHILGRGFHAESVS
ncbi:MAG: hypothetical protein J2P37_28610 [Ktedonobacteraceae bacterium]|nr:hypothetical protein [Ktedonobacteraceae bacterium]